VQNPRAQDAGAGPVLNTVLTTQVPVSSGGTSSNELGLQAKSSVAGRVTAIRFYKMLGDLGPHIGHLWNTSGTLLATATFVNETPSGWQEQAITPVAIDANVVFVASVNNPSGAHYATIKNGYSKAIVNNTLTGSIGVYAASGRYPATRNSDNYFRDIVFDSSPSPETVTTGLTDGTAATGRMSVPGVVNGLKVGRYTVTLSLRDESGRILTSTSNIQVLSFPFKSGDSVRSWAYTWVSTATESAPSASATVPGPLTGGPFYAQVAGIAVGPTGTIARKLYRTTSGGTQLKLVSILTDNTSTIYDDHIADIDLGANVPNVPNAPAPALAPTISLDVAPK